MFVNIINNLNSKQQQLFLLILSERMFCTYKKYSRGKMKEYIEGLNETIEKHWNYLINGIEHDCIVRNEKDDMEKYKDYKNTCDKYSNELHLAEESIDILYGLVEGIYCILPLLTKEEDYAFSRNNFEGALEIIIDFINYCYNGSLELYREIFKNYYEYKDYSKFFTNFVEENEFYLLENNREKRDIEYLQKETDYNKIYHRYHYELEEILFSDKFLDKNDIAEQKFIPEQIKRENTPDFFQKYGYTYQEFLRYNNSIFYHTREIILKSRLFENYRERANAYEKLGEHQKAIDDLNKSIELNPDDAQNYHSRGYNYAQLGERQRAIDDYSKAIALNPNYALAYLVYYNRAYDYDEIGENEKAIADLNKSIELNPNYAQAYCNRSHSYNKVGEYQKALDDCDKAETINPQLPEIYCNRGDSYYALGEYEKSISNYTKALALDPKDKESYEGRAKVYRLLGEIDKAIADEEKASKL